MSEGDWSSEARGLEPSKRRVPLWVWGCGGGCALFLLVAVILGVFVFRMVNKATNQELNWTGIEEVLPVVERPAGYMVFGSPMRFDGVRFWALTAADQSHQIVLLHAEGGGSVEETRRELLGGPGGSAGAGQVSSTISVQGRDLPMLRYAGLSGGAGGGGMLEEVMKQFGEGAHANVDLTPTGASELLVLTYTEHGAGAVIEDQEVIEFLDHFRLPGGDRPSTPAAAPPVEVPAEPATPPKGEEGGG